jgi:hypothetical protein
MVVTICPSLNFQNSYILLLRVLLNKNAEDLKRVSYGICYDNSRTKSKHFFCVNH